jgi:two-component system invasion response regulator UvrY
MYKIAIAEDHKYMREYISLLCQTLGFVLIFLAPDGQKLEDYLSSNEANPLLLPDIILMDICMPIINGIAVTVFVARHFPSIKIIALSLYTHEKPVIDMLRSGAKGFIDKHNIDSNELLLAVKIVMNNEQYISPSVLKEWGISSDHLQTGYHENYKTCLLSDREYGGNYSKVIFVEWLA